MATDEAAVDLCALLVVQAVPALALDPKVPTPGWERLLGMADSAAALDVVIGFVTSEPIRSWAALMRQLGDEDRTDEWDEYRAETLILAQVVIGALEVFDKRAGWAQALECEAFVGSYRQQIWHRARESVLSDAVLAGASFEDLFPACVAAGRGWADECRSRHEAAARPWPPSIPRFPPPQPRRSGGLQAEGPS
jgi:hypothetical protein